MLPLPIFISHHRLIFVSPLPASFPHLRSTPCLVNTPPRSPYGKCHNRVPLTNHRMDPLHTRIMEAMGATVMLFRVVVWHPNAHLRALLDWAYGVEELLGMFTQQKLTKPTLAQERKAVR
jgi:hypothetical protein